MANKRDFNFDNNTKINTRDDDDDDVDNENLQWRFHEVAFRPQFLDRIGI